MNNDCTSFNRLLRLTFPMKFIQFVAFGTFLFSLLFPLNKWNDGGGDDDDNIWSGAKQLELGIQLIS